MERGSIGGDGQEWLIKDQADLTGRKPKSVVVHASSDLDYEHAKFTLSFYKRQGWIRGIESVVFDGQVNTAVAGVQIADSNLKTYLAGPWKPDVAAAQAKLCPRPSPK